MDITDNQLYTKEDIKLLSNCTLCPRECGVNRFRGGSGYCGTDAGYNIASICIHTGEEPVISGKNGICNIFFGSCNLRCIYCQNHEISRPGYITRQNFRATGTILDFLVSIFERGISSVGFVSPSHLVPQVKAIIKGLHSRGIFPVTVYNTNGYDKVEVVGSLDGLINVWLPDYKYVSSAAAASYSDAADYPTVAIKALKEMYFQKGSTLHINDEGIADNGLIIRHLVLPGAAGASKKALRRIAEELSPGVHISLMSQYHPVAEVSDHPLLSRSLYMEEYQAVVAEMERLGFRNGWVQDVDSYRHYRPDFSKDKPF